MPAQVKGQDNIDFGLLQKASITASVPTAAACGTDAAGKVWITELPGAYTGIQAGHLFAHILGNGTGPSGIIYTTDPDALVVLTTDLAGTNPIHSGRANALGKITFYPDLPSGTTVYLRRYKTGVDYINPDIEVIP